MWDGFYSPHRQAHNPIYNDDIIYTPAVTVFKTDTEQPEIMDASDWYNVDVITCAAPNLRVKNNYNGKSSYNNAKKMTNDELLKLHEKRLKRILDTALSEDDEKAIKMAFNLFSGDTPSINNYGDSINQVKECKSYTVKDLFCSSYAPYFWQAIQIRYPEYTK